MTIAVYCGFDLNTAIYVKANLLDIDIFDISCLECHGTGECPYQYEEVESDCVYCKVAGKQYI